MKASNFKPLAPCVESDPERLGGDPVVAGTRIPTQMVRQAWEYGGDAEVRSQYPQVTETQAMCAVAFEAGRAHESGHPSHCEELLTEIAVVLADFSHHIGGEEMRAILEHVRDVTREG